MNWLRGTFAGALALSLAVHIGSVAVTMKDKPVLEEEGAGEIQHAVLGQSPFSTIVAGSTAASTTDPVDPPPVQIPLASRTAAQTPAETSKPVEAARAAAVKPVEIEQPRTPIAPAESISLPSPSPNALAVQAVKEARPADTLTAAPVDPARTVESAKQAQTTPAQQVQASAVDAKPVEIEQVETEKLQAKPAEAQKTVSETAQTPAASPVKPTPETAEPLRSEAATPLQAATAETVSPTEQEYSDAEAVPAPRLKPKPPVKTASKAKPTERKVQAQAQAQPKKAEQKRKAAKASNSGAGGKSSRTAQKGGSQRKGKSKTAGNSDVTNYPAKVHRKILRSVRAPRKSARARKDTLVTFTVKKNGSVAGIRLARSSGSKPFDQAVMKAVKRAAPYPPIPGASGKNSWIFTLPVGMR